MSIKALEEVWHKYPRSTIHCNVTRAGLDSYQVVASLVDHEGESICTVTHYGNGDLQQVKTDAYGKLATELKQQTDS